MVALKKTADHRPVFLNLLQIRLPVCALVSILHRVTGVAIVLFFPILILKKKDFHNIDLSLQNKASM